MAFVWICASERDGHILFARHKESLASGSKGTAQGALNAPTFAT